MSKKKSLNFNRKVGSIRVEGSENFNEHPIVNFNVLIGIGMLIADSSMSAIIDRRSPACSYRTLFVVADFEVNNS
jgi:hypothetical protein